MRYCAILLIFVIYFSNISLISRAQSKEEEIFQAQQVSQSPFVSGSESILDGLENEFLIENQEETPNFGEELNQDQNLSPFVEPIPEEVQIEVNNNNPTNQPMPEELMQLAEVEVFLRSIGNEGEESIVTVMPTETAITEEQIPQGQEAEEQAIAKPVPELPLIISEEPTIEESLVEEENNKSIESPSYSFICSNPTDYLFPNQTCLPNCPDDYFIESGESNQKLCTLCDANCATCAGTSKNCTSCSSGFELVSAHDDNDHDYDEKQNTCAPVQASRIDPVVQPFIDYDQTVGAIITAQVTTLQVLTVGSSFAIPTILIVEVIKHVKYLDINYPPKLLQSFAGTGSRTVSFDFGPSLPESLTKDAHFNPPQLRFSRFSLSGVFLANFWSGIITMLTLMLLVYLLNLIMRQKLKNKLLNTVLTLVKILLVWNQIICFWMSNAGRMILYIFLEFKTLYLGSSLRIISFIMSLAFLIGNLIWFAYAHRLIYSIRKKTANESMEEKLKQYAHIKVLFENLDNRKFLQEYKVVIVTFRVVLQSFILTVMNSPVLQTSLLLFLNFVMISYYVIYRPYKERLRNIEQVVYEVIVCIVNGICLSLALMDPSEQFQANGPANAIIIFNFMILFLIMAFRFNDVRKLFKEILRYWKNKSTFPAKAKYIDPSPILNCLALPNIFFQNPEKEVQIKTDVDEQGLRQGAYGFDDVCEMDEENVVENEAYVWEESEKSRQIDDGEDSDSVGNSKEIREREDNNGIILRIMGDNICNVPHVAGTEYPSLGIPIERQTRDKLNPYFG